MEKLKLTDIVVKYSREEGEFEQWIDKVQNAVKLLKAEDEVVHLIPLFFTGVAHSTWKNG